MIKQTMSWDENLSPSRQRSRRKNLPVVRTDWDDHLKTLRAGEFERRYRMDETKFTYLLDQCAEQSEFFRPLTPENRKLHHNLYGADPIDVRHKLAAALRWLAGGSYLDVRLVHGISRETLYTCVWQAVDAINASPGMRMEFPWHDDVKLQNLEKGFAGLCGGKLRGCVFAVDGFCVRIICPGGAVNPRDYWHRKGFYAFVVQAVVDATGKFLAASLKAVGSTHDSLAFKMSKFHSMLEKGLLRRETGVDDLHTYFGMGDDAYACREFLVTPWPGRNLGDVKDNFNYYQSRLRIVVECAFGRLVKRWGCLWRPLQVAYWRVPALVTALMKLHNLCDRNSEVPILPEDLSHFMKTNQLPLVFHNNNNDKGVARQRRRERARVSKRRRDEDTREVVTDNLREIGAVRPPHSRYRMRKSMQCARTKQTARKSTEDRAPKKTKVTAAGAAGAAAPAVRKTIRRRNYHWTKKGSKESRRQARQNRKRRAIDPTDFVYRTPSPQKRRANSAHADTAILNLPAASDPATAGFITPPALGKSAQHPPQVARKRRRKVRADFAATARRNMEPDPARNMEPDSARRNKELDPALKARAVETLSKLMSMDVPACDTAPLKSVRASYSWSGGSTTLHYPVQCRPRLAYVEERQIAESLVDADPRIPPACPPPEADVWTTDGAVIYQYQRANILREMLIDVTAAYNIATGQPARRLPVPPVVDPGVSPTSGTESDSEGA